MLINLYFLRVVFSCKYIDTKPSIKLFVFKGFWIAKHHTYYCQTPINSVVADQLSS